MVDLKVGRTATQALDVDTPLCRVKVERLKRTPLAQCLDLVNMLISTIIPGTRVALGVLVGHGRAKGVENSTGCNILGGDEDDGLALALDLVFLDNELVPGTCVAWSY